MVTEVGIRIPARKEGLVRMRLTVRQTKSWKNAAMNVLELVQMRAVVLSPGIEKRLRLAREQVKLRQVDVYAKERRSFERYLNEKVSGPVHI